MDHDIIHNILPLLFFEQHSRTPLGASQLDSGVACIFIDLQAGQIRHEQFRDVEGRLRYLVHLSPDQFVEVA